MYEGRGDHAADEYSWYYGWEVVRQHWERAVPNKDAKILLPGIGNDPLLLDLVSSGWQQCTAFDYTESAIERQRDLLSYNPQATSSVQLQVWDATALPDEMSSTPFDAVLEKGALDAIYLSGEGQVEKAARELWRVTKRGGVCLSFRVCLKMSEKVLPRVRVEVAEGRCRRSPGVLIQSGSLGA